MRVEVTREALAVAHSIATRAVASASRAIPQVLTDIRYTAAGGELTLSAMDGTTSITTRIPATVEEEGSTAVLPSPLGEVLGALTCATVRLRLGDKRHSLVVEGARSTSTLRGQDPVDYPPIPTLPKAIAGTAPASVFAAAARQCVIAAATHDTAPILNGVSLRVDGDIMTLAAADRFRLAVRTGRLTPGGAPIPLRTIVPAVALAEFVKTAPPGDGHAVSFGLTDDGKTIVLRAGPTEYSTRVIEGDYIDYAPLIPESCASRATLATDDLRKALRTVALFARASGNLMSLTTIPGEGDTLGSLVLGAEATEAGASSTPVDAVVEGASVTLYCNADYLIGFLNVVRAKLISLELESATRPATLRPIDESDLTYLVMPMSRPTDRATLPATHDGQDGRDGRDDGDGDDAPVAATRAPASIGHGIKKARSTKKPA
jgi:DNA polymerase-3 subunit beta